jgi:hypothetical protein
MPDSKSVSSQIALVVVAPSPRADASHVDAAARHLSDSSIELRFQSSDGTWLAFARKDDEVIGKAEFIVLDNVGSYMTIQQSGQKLWVRVEHRRNGIATAMYVLAELATGAVMVKATEQTSAAKAFWARAGRPFGHPPNSNASERE